MTVRVWTATSDYPGPNRLDVSTGPFSPEPELENDPDLSLKDYQDKYRLQMRDSYKRQRTYWNVVLEAKEIVLVCGCQDPSECHRSVLARILGKLGATIEGEKTEWDTTDEEKEERPAFTGNKDELGVGTAILVTGDRKWSDHEAVRSRLSLYPKGSVLIEGECSGLDRIAAGIAVELGMTVMPMPPNAKATADSRFKVRNQAMVAVLASLRWCNWTTHVEAFVLPTSKGTWDCVNKAKKKGFDPHITRIG